MHLTALALVAAASLAVWHSDPRASRILLFDLILMAIFVAITLGPIYRMNGPNGATARMVTSVLLVSILFSQLAIVVPGLNSQRYDEQLLHIDRAYFWFDPLNTLDDFTTPVLTDILEVGYFSFYLLPIMFFIVLYRRKLYHEIEASNLAVVTGFYVSFIGNVLFPAASPYRIMTYETELAGVFLFEPLHRLVDVLEVHQLSAFPSGHILVAAVIVILARRFCRDVSLYFLLWGVMLWFGTIYLRYHYFIDTLAAVPLAPFCVMFASGFGNRAGRPAR